jgi:hypothetical protein
MLPRPPCGGAAGAGAPGGWGAGVWLITIALAPQTSAIVTHLLDDRFMIVSTPNDDRLEAGSCFTVRRRSACT